MKKPSKNADIHLISVLDDMVGDGNDFSTVAKPAGNDAVVLLDDDTVHLFNSIQRLKRLRSNNAPEVVIESERKLIREYRNAAEKAMGNELIAVMLSSKTKYHLLLDSVGGCPIDGTPYSSMAERAVETIAYATREASSLACNTLLDADRAYCLNDSHILWHLGRNDEAVFGGENEEDTRQLKMLQDENDDEIWDAFTGMMNERCKPKKRGRLKTKLQASRGHERREVVFSGRELADYGVISGSFDTTDQLVEKFCDETGIAKNKVQKTPAAGLFFNLAFMSEAISKEAGFNCSLMIDRGTGEFAIRIVEDKDDTHVNETKTLLILRKIVDQAGR